MEVTSRSSLPDASHLLDQILHISSLPDATRLDHVLPASSLPDATRLLDQILPVSLMLLVF